MRTRIAVEAFLFRQTPTGREYLVLHRVPTKGGFWQGLTGGVEDTDGSLLAALYRELGEELGLTQEDILAVIPEYGSWSFADKQGDDKCTITEHGFGVEVRPTFDVRLGDEHDDMRWLPLDDALALFKYETNKDALRQLDTLLAETVGLPAR